MPCDAPVMTATFWLTVVMMLVSLSKKVARMRWSSSSVVPQIGSARRGDARADAGSATSAPGSVRAGYRPGCSPGAQRAAKREYRVEADPVGTAAELRRHRQNGVSGHDDDSGSGGNPRRNSSGDPKA